MAASMATGVRRDDERRERPKVASELRSIEGAGGMTTWGPRWWSWGARGRRWRSVVMAWPWLWPEAAGEGKGDDNGVRFGSINNS